MRPVGRSRRLAAGGRIACRRLSRLGPKRALTAASKTPRDRPRSDPHGSHPASSASPSSARMGGSRARARRFRPQFLLPQGKALRATNANRERFERERVQLEARNLERRTEAQAVGEKLDGKSFVAIRQAGETGQLYGSVSTRDIADLIEAGGFSIERNQVLLNHPIKTSACTRSRSRCIRKSASPISSTSPVRPTRRASGARRRPHPPQPALRVRRGRRGAGGGSRGRRDDRGRRAGLILHRRLNTGNGRVLLATPVFFLSGQCLELPRRTSLASGNPDNARRSRRCFHRCASETAMNRLLHAFPVPACPQGKSADRHARRRRGELR